MKLPVLMGCARRKLSPEEAYFILSVLMLDRHQRRAAGFQRGTRGIYTRLARIHGVQTITIEKIALRKTWRCIPIPHLYDISLKHRHALAYSES